MLHFTGQHILQHEFSFEKENDQSKTWHEQYPGSNFGFAVSFMSLNTKVLGNGIAMFPYLNFPIKKSEKFVWKLRLAAGIGHIDKPFDWEKNYKNTAIGSRLNIFFNIQSELDYQIHKKHHIAIGSSFSHFSNTSFQQPNLGINLLGAHLAYSYRFNKESKSGDEREHSIPFVNRYSFWDVSFGLGISETFPGIEKKHLSENLSIYRMKRYSKRSSLGLGIDGYHSPAQSEMLERDSIFINKGWESSQFGLGINHFLHIGKFAMISKVGYYMKTKNEELGKVYSGFGGYYQFNPKWACYFLAKTHQAKAEYLLLGIRFQLRNDEK